MGIFELAEFESVVKIAVTPFSLTLGHISARNLRITREWWAIRARRCLHRVSCRIFRKDRALWRKLWKRQDCSNCPYR